MNTMRIGVVGLGTVGAGTVSILRNTEKELARRSGVNIKVTAASARDLKKPRDCELADIALFADALELVRDDNVDVVVELMGGEELAKDIVSLAIELGKPVVTANKALIAVHGAQLLGQAAQAGVPIKFEAAVAGGIPIIKALREGLAANRIDLVAGIINGTGNFILTEMKEKGRSFPEVLAEAQALGYAEADPTFDIEGIDAAHKLTILASLAFGIPLQFDAVYTEGISQLKLDDLAYAKEFGYRIKHLGIAKRVGDGVELRVHPTLIPQKRLIAHVNGVMNAVLVKGDSVGNTLHYGAGAGALPTASAVVADLLDLAKESRLQNDQRQWTQSAWPLGFVNNEIDELPIKPASEFRSAYYLRIEVSDEVGVMSKLTTAFAEQNISLEGIKQKEPNLGEDGVSVILITKECVEHQINTVIDQLKAMPAVREDIMRIRVEYLN